MWWSEVVEALIQEKNKLTHFASNRELHFKFKTLLDFQTVKSHLHYRKNRKLCSHSREKEKWKSFESICSITKCFQLFKSLRKSCKHGKWSYLLVKQNQIFSRYSGKYKYWNLNLISVNLLWTLVRRKHMVTWKPETGIKLSLELKPGPQLLIENHSERIR